MGSSVRFWLIKMNQARTYNVCEIRTQVPASGSRKEKRGPGSGSYAPGPEAAYFQLTNVKILAPSPSSNPIGQSNDQYHLEFNVSIKNTII